MNQKYNLRMAQLMDAERLLEIYAPYVKNTAISFEYEVPDIETFKKRISNVLEKYPYLVAEDMDGKIIGYAYVSPFKTRSAYDWCVETSIYVDINCKRCGVGTALYTELENKLKKMGILNMNACIASPNEYSEFLNNDSIEFHKHMGYMMVGKFHKCGYKFGNWYDMVWMEKHIGEHTNNQEKVLFGRYE